MEYKCEYCNFNTKKKYNYDKHLLSNKHKLVESKSVVNLKTPQSQHLVNIESSQSQPIAPPKSATQFECKYCEQKFKFKQSMYRHIKYSCTKNKTEDLTELVRLLNLQLAHKDTQLETQSKQIEKLMSKLEINNYTNSNNTIINNVTNNINLLNYDETDTSHLTNKDYKKCIKQVYNCVMKMIEKVHFNPDKPENMNLYISNIKSKHIMMYKDNKWIITPNTELDSIYADKDNLIKTWLEENEIKDPELIEKFNKCNNMDEKKLKNVYDEINFMLFNNKHLVNKDLLKN